MEQNEYLDQFERNLTRNLVQYLQGIGRLDKGPLPNTPDISERWSTIVESYCADAMKEIAKYPLVALGWAMYTGMALAKYWDDGWEVYSKHPNLYQHLRDVRGFDYLDEVVRFDLIKWDCEELVRSCAQMAQDQIRHEQIEPSSPMAYHVYMCSIHALYEVGAAVGLKHLGYSMTKQ